MDFPYEISLTTRVAASRSGLPDRSPPSLRCGSIPAFIWVNYHISLTWIYQVKYLNLSRFYLTYLDFYPDSWKEQVVVERLVSKKLREHVEHIQTPTVHRKKKHLKSHKPNIYPSYCWCIWQKCCFNTCIPFFLTRTEGKLVTHDLVHKHRKNKHVHVHNIMTCPYT